MPHVFWQYTYVIYIFGENLFQIVHRYKDWLESVVVPLKILSKVGYQIILFKMVLLINPVNIDKIHVNKSILWIYLLSMLSLWHSCKCLNFFFLFLVLTLWELIILYLVDVANLYFDIAQSNAFFGLKMTSFH